MTTEHRTCYRTRYSDDDIYKSELMELLFELGCTYSGEEISLTKLLGQLQDAGNATTLANYLTTLDESQLQCGLRKYANDNARKYNSAPNFASITFRC